jgi:predicted Zn-dependent protease
VKSRLASQIALFAVIVVVGASFLWWFRERPSYLLYQAHRGVGGENQAAAIAEYKRLLSSNKLEHADEMTYRLALGELYLRAVQENTGVSLLYKEDDTKPTSPFLNSAKSEFERIIELDPKNAQAHYYLGRILWLQNLEAFALKELETSREMDPTNPETLRYLSLIHQERGDPATGRELALQALASHPSHDESRMALVQAYALLGDHANSLKEYDRLSPGFRETPLVRAQHAFYLAQQNYWNEAADEIERAVNADPQNGWAKIFYGRILLERGLVEEAAGAFAQAQALMPKSVWPLVWRAAAQSRRGECEEPVRDGQLLTEVLPRWPWGRMVTAWAALCRGDDRKAVSDLDEALRLSHEFPEAAQLKAEILLDRGQYDELGRVIRPMLDQKVIQTDGDVLLSKSFLAQGNGELAAEMAEAAIRLNQQDHRAFAALGMARAMNRDIAGADRAFDEALRLNSYDTTIAAEAAHSHAMGAGDPTADATFRSLSERDPRNAELWTLWGDVQLKAGHHSDAVQSFQTAVALKPYLLRAQLGLVEADVRLGALDRAESALGAAAAINSRNKDVMAWRARMRRS